MRTALLAMGVAALAQSGCGGVNCGPGTYKQGDNCVGFDPNDHTPPVTTISPVGERSRSVVPDPIVLTPNEPATVYYTTDGTDPDPAATPGHRDMATIRALGNPTTVKYFSVDTAGNREGVQTATFVQDLTGPAAVSGMAVNLAGTTAHVTWTNPTDSDYAGTAVARVIDVVDAAPIDGTMPLLNDTLSGSLQIVALGTGTSFDDAGLRPGIARYVAWAYDDLGNFGPPTTATATVPFGSLTAQLQYDTGMNKLTFVSVPADIDISTSTAGVSGGTLTLSIVAKNQSAAYLQNPKIEVTAITNATLNANDGTADTFPFRSMGTNAFFPGAKVTTNLVFTTSGTVITIDLKFAGHGSLMATYGSYGYFGSAGIQLLDLGTGSGTLVKSFSLVTSGPGGRTRGRPRPAAFIGGHFVDIPSTHGVVERFDLATGSAAGVAPLLEDADQANVQGMLAANGGELAVIKLGGKGNPRYSSGNDALVKIVRLDEGLHVVQAAAYTFTDSSGMCAPTLSPDGSTLAIASGDALALIDARTLQQIDSDPATPEADLFTSASQGRIGSIVWLSNTDLVVLARKTGQAAVIHRTGNTATTALLYDDKTTLQGGFAAALAPDGKVWMSFPASVTDPAGIMVYDPVANATTTLAGYTPIGGAGTSGLVRLGSDMWVIHGDHMGMDRVDASGTTLQTITLPSVSPYGYVCSPSCNGIYGHWLQLAPQ